MEDEGQAFWMVWSPQGNPPTRKHDTEEGAIREAERLARVTPDAEFIVLVAIHMRSVKSPMKRVRLLQELPF